MEDVRGATAHLLHTRLAGAGAAGRQAGQACGASDGKEVYVCGGCMKAGVYV